MAETEIYDDDDLSKSEEQTLIEEAKTRFQMARDHWRDWRDEARKCFEFYSGHQWSDDDIEYLESQLRVPITFNRVQPYIDAVLGHETNNRQELKYIPRTSGDAAVNEIVSQVAAYYTDECDGEYADSEAFKHMLICGIGWTETRLDDTENPDYDLIRECVNPLHVLPDPTSERPCFGDARYVFKITDHSRAEVEYMFPEWDGDYEGGDCWDFYGEEDAPEDDGELLGPRDSYLSNDGETNDTAGRDITVVQYQYKDYEDVWMVRDPNTGREKVIPEELYEEYKDRFKAEGIEIRKRKRVVCRMAYIVGSQVVKSAVVCKNDFTLQAVTGKRDVSQKTWHGIMRSLMDVQQWSNKFLSQMLHIINSQAKGGLDIEESAVSDIEQFEAKYAQPGALLVYRDGALQNNRVKERSSVQFPAQFERLLQYANSSFGDVAGINSELLGMADREQPGVLEYQRRQSAVSLLAPLFDSLRLYRKRMGRVWLYFIQKYLADGRIARITIDPQQLQAMQNPQQPGMPGQPPQAMTPQSKIVAIAVNPELLGDPDTAKYDIIVDQAASAPNQKEATWAVLTQLGPMLQDVVTPEILIKFLEYSPLPESLMEEIKVIAAQKAQQGPQEPPEVTKAKMEMQVKQQTAQQEMALKQEETQADIELEKFRTAAKLELEREQAMMKMMLEREKHNLKMQMDREKAEFDAMMKERMNRADIQAKQAEIDYASEKFNPASDAMSKGMENFASNVIKANADLGAALEKLAEAMSKPKQIVRGPDGRAIGVQ